ncbi:MAG: hypothetical protein AAGA56_28805, partial [Myxococcota bacterium]
MSGLSRAGFWVALFFCLAACSPSPGENVPLEQLCGDASKHEKRVTVEGFITTKGMITFCSQGTCSLSLRADAAKEDPSVTIGIRPGGGANQMAELPERFKPEDLKVVDKEGQQLGNLSKVAVTGKALTGEGCQLLDVDLI